MQNFEAEFLSFKFNFNFCFATRIDIGFDLWAKVKLAIGFNFGFQYTICFPVSTSALLKFAKISAYNFGFACRITKLNFCHLSLTSASTCDPDWHWLRLKGKRWIWFRLQLWLTGASASAYTLKLNLVSASALAYSSFCFGLYAKVEPGFDFSFGLQYYVFRLRFQLCSILLKLRLIMATTSHAGLWSWISVIWFRLQNHDWHWPWLIDKSRTWSRLIFSFQYNMFSSFEFDFSFARIRQNLGLCSLMQ